MYAKGVGSHFYRIYAIYGFTINNSLYAGVVYMYTPVYYHCCLSVQSMSLVLSNMYHISDHMQLQYIHTLAYSVHVTIQRVVLLYQEGHSVH